MLDNPVQFLFQTLNRLLESDENDDAVAKFANIDQIDNDDEEEEKEVKDEEMRAKEMDVDSVLVKSHHTHTLTHRTHTYE